MKENDKPVRIEGPYQLLYNIEERKKQEQAHLDSYIEMLRMWRGRFFDVDMHFAGRGEIDDPFKGTRVK